MDILKLHERERVARAEVLGHAQIAQPLIGNVFQVAAHLCDRESGNAAAQEIFGELGLAVYGLLNHLNDLFVHAGIRPGVPMGEQTEDDLVWIRKGWLEDSSDHGPLVVHGHTALEYPCHHGNRVNLDGGAAYGRPLAAAVIEGREVFLLTPEGRERMRPDPA